MLIFLARLIRVPVAIIAEILVIVISLLSLIIETPVALMWFVVLAVFSGSNAIVNSWIYSYPNSIKSVVIHILILNIFIWAWNVDREFSYRNYGEACNLTEDEDAPSGFKAGWCFFIFTAVSVFLAVITVYKVWLPVIILTVILLVILVAYFLYKLPND